MTTFVIPKFIDEGRDNYEALNISDEDDDAFDGYASPTESIGELADMVDDLENMSIHALKEKKLSMRRLVLTQIHDVKKEIEKRLKK
jgi:hypothetical protein